MGRRIIAKYPHLEGGKGDGLGAGYLQAGDLGSGLEARQAGVPDGLILVKAANATGALSR